ncbi:rhodanese-related sulfurtransferase [Haloferula luteola]|uniref:Rhodanese-related sulfurtransferase n=1 Tax=Haloferula luteola TaxID=595692 RepID=A0A840V9A1_9BACT|nr:rhodanese-like domain-containing protein [Haloferula luteola]MBB5353646.1 rhodanese-related sulfurtransferase [Haloferula luteola]
MKSWLTTIALLPTISCAVEVADIPEVEKHLKIGTQILDVRTAEEWQEGHLDHALHADIQRDDFVAIAKAQLDPEKPVVIYCKSGKRSARASNRLEEAGFQQVIDLKGGMTAWLQAGKPVVVDPPTPIESKAAPK